MPPGSTGTAVTRTATSAAPPSSRSPTRPTATTPTASSTSPGSRADEQPSPDLDALTPGPVGGGWLEHVPDDDPADTTGVQPVATCELGAPVDQYLDDLFPDGQYVGELFDGLAEAKQ